MQGYDLEDREYAASRLDGTIVMCNGLPVEVKSVWHEGKERFCDVPKGVMSPVSIKCVMSGDRSIVNLSELDITPVKLGFVNYQGTATYLTRVPMRRDYRQGTRYSNFTNLGGVSSNDIPYSKIAKTILGDFPSIDEAKRDIRRSDSIHTVAVHRRWCIDGEDNLIYKTLGIVGVITEGRPALNDDHRYLQEVMHEDLVA